MLSQDSLPKEDITKTKRSPRTPLPQEDTIRNDTIRYNNNKMASNNNDEEDGGRSSRTIDTGMNKNQKLSGIDVNALPSNLRTAVDELNLDRDGDGRLDTQEIIMAVEHLAAKTKANTSLKKIVWLLCGFSVFLVAALFGASIAAARLAKDTEVDPLSGIAYAKGSAHSIMKTEEAKFVHDIRVAKLSNKELDGLKGIIMTSGDVKFQVKGYARSGTINGNQVMILVEGGTITYDTEGIMDASGDAERLLTFAYGDFTEVEAPAEAPAEAPTSRRLDRHSIQEPTIGRRLEDIEPSSSDQGETNDPSTP